MCLNKLWHIIGYGYDQLFDESVGVSWLLFQSIYIMYCVSIEFYNDRWNNEFDPPVKLALKWDIPTHFVKNNREL